MKNPLRALLPGTALLALLLTGCALRSPEELYTLPQQSDSYLNLQDALDDVITGEIEYCAPSNGENRQAIQMADMDGDSRAEAIVFAKNESDAHPLKIFIFSGNGDESYSLIASIEGDGFGYESVSYAQVDGSPGLELAVGRSLQDGLLHTVSVYTLDGSLTTEMVTANYTAWRLTDLDNDGRSDLFVLRTVTDTGETDAELYRCRNGALVPETELPLSASAEPKRMVTGCTAEDVPAVFVESQLEDGRYATDVFVMDGKGFRNIAADSEDTTVRSYPAYSADVDGDGIIELPDMILTSDTSCQLISWYSLNTDGTREKKLLTYHDFQHGFYVELDDSWRNGLHVSIRTVEHGTAYVFTAGGSEQLFTLYLFSGNDAPELSRQDGRFLLLQKNDICCAGETDGSLTAEELQSRFHQIRTDWNSGEL